MKATTHGNILADVKAEALVDVQANTIAVVGPRHLQTH